MRQVSLGLSPAGSNDSRTRWILASLSEIEAASRVERFVDIAAAYTVENYTPTRSLDAATATASDLANFLATLITDLKAGEVVKG